MEHDYLSLREQRLQKLFADCQQQVISQIIGPFGLSTAMFEDKDGGNVTTLHNFDREDNNYVATESDKKLHAQSQKEYDDTLRSEYEVKTKAKAQGAGGKTWEQKRQDRINQGTDEYTGHSISSDGLTDTSNGSQVGVDLDHVVSVKEIHANKKAHLALGEDNGGSEADVTRIRAAINSDENLALTSMSANRSKGDKDLKEWADKKRKDGSTNTEHYELDEKRVAQKYKEAKKHIDSTVNKALLKKQTTELLATGGQQAMQMGVRQALGVLLTELVNALFNEFKVLIKQGVEAGKTLFEEIRQRLARVVESVAKKAPDALSQLFQGGISGFMSNLLTFLVNNFLSTAKRFVRVIREGLISLFRAFKMIFFPPKNMSASEALQEGLKILTATILTAVGILLETTVNTFVASIPVLGAFASIISPVLIGIMTGLLSAFLAYQIDALFDRYRHSYNEKFMDELMADAKRRNQFANDLTSLSESSMANIENYAKSISIYQNIGVTLGSAGMKAAATLASLEKTVTDTKEQVRKIVATTDFIKESQIEIDDFLSSIKGN